MKASRSAAAPPSGRWAAASGRARPSSPTVDGDGRGEPLDLEHHRGAGRRARPACRPPRPGSRRGSRRCAGPARSRGRRGGRPRAVRPARASTRPAAGCAAAAPRSTPTPPKIRSGRAAASVGGSASSAVWRAVRRLADLVDQLVGGAVPAGDDALLGEGAQHPADVRRRRRSRRRRAGAPASSDSRCAVCAATACTSQPGRSVGVDHCSAGTFSSRAVKSLRPATTRRRSRPARRRRCRSAGGRAHGRHPSGTGSRRLRQDGRGYDMRVRAPELAGRGWLNTSGPIRLRDLRGRFVLLDFWTFCCINCLHVLDELRPVEEKYADELVVIGVHSPKFVHEADPDALVAAVERYDVHHPVLDDPDLTTWGAYTARAWPTLVLVDPEGYVVAHYAGEGHAHAIDALLAELVAEHRDRGTLQPGDSPYVPPESSRTPTCASRPRRRAARREPPRRRRRPPQPGRAGRRARRTPHRCRRARLRGRRPAAVQRAQRPLPAARRRRRRGGVRRRWSRTPSTTRSRGVDLASGETRTVAGDGRQWMQGDGTDPALAAPGTWPGGRTGSGSRWPASTSCGPSTRATGAVEAAAGTTNEGLRRRPARRGVVRPAVRAGARRRPAVGRGRGDRALRVVADGAVRTVRRARALRLRVPRRRPPRRPCCSTRSASPCCPTGPVAVADTYNGAVRRFDPATGLLSTLAVRPGRALRRRRQRRPARWWSSRPGTRSRSSTPRPPARTRSSRPPPSGRSPRSAARSPSTITFSPPPGQKVDDRFGPATQLVVSATPASLIKDGDGRGTDLHPHADARPRGRRRGAPRRRPRRVVRRRRRRGRGLPDAPAGLGRPDPGGHRRRGPAGPPAGWRGRLTSSGRTDGRRTTYAGRARGWCLLRRAAGAGRRPRWWCGSAGRSSRAPARWPGRRRR